MVLLYLLLIGGVAGRVSLEKIDDWFGSNGYDGGLTSSASDGSRIALTGTQSEDGGYEESYLTVVGDDLDLLLRNNYRTEHLEDVLKEPYIYKFGTLCRNQALVADGEYGIQVEPSEWVLDGYVQVGYFRDSCDDEDLVVLYDDVAIRGGREACDVDLDEALGWDRATSFALSEKSATAYVVGRHKDSDDRAVAAVKMEEDRCEVIWHANIATDEGTPRILAVNNDDRVEILLTSNEFFARVDRGTSSREGGDVKTLLIEKQLWLPGEGEAIVAYSDAEDVIFSAGYVVGKALLRASSADTGRELYEIDFTDELDAEDPGSVREDYDMDDEAFYEWAENTWKIKGAPTITGIHVLGDKVAVVGAYRGEIADEDGYHYPFVALFGKGDDGEASPGEPEVAAPAGTTFFGAGVGWCNSNLNDNVGIASTPAECWDLCVDVHGADSIFAVDVSFPVDLSFGDCYCQSSCDCMMGDYERRQVIARDTLEELPDACIDDDYYPADDDDYQWRDDDDDDDTLDSPGEPEGSAPDDFGEDDCVSCDSEVEAFVSCAVDTGLDADVVSLDVDYVESSHISTCADVAADPNLPIICNMVSGGSCKASWNAFVTCVIESSFCASHDLDCDITCGAADAADTAGARAGAAIAVLGAAALLAVA